MLVKRRSLINWLCLAGCLGVFTVVVYGGLYREWSEHGIPGWYLGYLAWQKRVGVPVWWPL